MTSTIMIVEDEPDLAGLLSDVLEVNGYSVVLTTGSRAVERALQVRPAAVVIDYLMPGLNGGQVIDQLRAAVETHLPVVLVTGLSNVEQLARASHADAFLRKPFDVDRFVRIINDLSSASS